MKKAFNSVFHKSGSSSSANTLLELESAINGGSASTDPSSKLLHPSDNEEKEHKRKGSTPSLIIKKFETLSKSLNEKLSNKSSESKSRSVSQTESVRSDSNSSKVERIVSNIKSESSKESKSEQQVKKHTSSVNLSPVIKSAGRESFLGTLGSPQPRSSSPSILFVSEQVPKTGSSVPDSSILSSRPPLPSSSNLPNMKSCSSTVLPNDRFSSLTRSGSGSPSASERRTKFSQHFSSESSEGSTTRVYTKEITVPRGSIKDMSSFLKSSTSIEQLEEEGGCTYIVTTSDGDESGGDGSESDGQNGRNMAIVTRKVTPPSTLSESVSLQNKFEAIKSKNESMSTTTNSKGMKAMKTSKNESAVAKMSNSDMEVEESVSVSARKAALEGDGFSALKSAESKDHRKIMRVGDTVRSAVSNVKNAASKLISDEGSAEKKMFESAKEERLVSPSGSRFHQEKNMASSSSSRFISADGSKTDHWSMSKSSSSNISSYSTIQSIGSMTDLFNESFDGTPLAITSLHSPSNMLSLTVASSLGNSAGKSGKGSNRDSLMIEDITSDAKTLETEYSKAEKKLNELVEKLKKVQSNKEDQLSLLPQLRDTLKKSWFLLGCDLSSKLCSKLYSSGGLELLLNRIKSDDDHDLQMSSAQVLQYTLSVENVTHVLAAKDSDKIVDLATAISSKKTPVTNTNNIRAGIGILSNLFMSNEETCKELIKRGALEAVIASCRSVDTETQRNCAYALANLALFGGPEVHSRMISKKVPDWLLVLAFSADDFVRYNACHAIVVLASDKEVEVAVLKSTTLMLVEQFLEKHSATEMALSPLSRYYGQNKEWLKRYSGILDSDREEAKSLASFHFALTANIKKRQGTLVELTKEIKSLIDLLNKAASSPNAIASKYAAQALKLIGAEIPHKLSQQVPNWTVEDVKEWIKQIGFTPFINNFVNSKVDGDLLLQLNENMLRDDIGITNGILRKRFMRELAHLKIITDYSSCDSSNLAEILEDLGEIYLQYTYNMVNAGIDLDTLINVTEEQLATECNIDNSIHRQKIINSVQKMKEINPTISDSETEKSLDVFVSYRRSNGSQLASLLKVLLQMRGFSTFIDIERLEAGKFDCNLINSIRQAKHFILVLTPNALDRCIGDTECKDWVHKEIVEALKSNCNIIPVVENFDWPQPEDLPDDMRAVCRFNGIRWIHEYQDACIDKLDRFMKGILASGELEQHNKQGSGGDRTGTPVPTSATSTPATPSLNSRNLSSPRNR